MPATYFSNPHVPSPTYSRATLGANDAQNKLFIAFLFSDDDYGVQFLGDVGLLQTVWCAVSADHKCPYASTVVLKPFTNDDMWGPYLLSVAPLQLQLGTVLVFSRVTWCLHKFYSSLTTSFISILLTLSSKSIFSVLQPLLIGPNSEERSCWTMSQKIVGPNKTVEINDSKLGWRKYNRGHEVKGQ